MTTDLRDGLLRALNLPVDVDDERLVDDVRDLRDRHETERAAAQAAEAELAALRADLHDLAGVPLEQPKPDAWIVAALRARVERGSTRLNGPTEREIVVRHVGRPEAPAGDAHAFFQRAADRRAAERLDANEAALAHVADLVGRGEVESVDWRREAVEPTAPNRAVRYTGREYVEIAITGCGA